MNDWRSFHTASWLANGNVLLASGRYEDGIGSEIFDAKTGRFAFTVGLNVYRGYATATVLLDGSVLFVGGAFSEEPYDGDAARAELFEGY
jgi:hypothetical protein